MIGGRKVGWLRKVEHLDLIGVVVGVEKFEMGVEKFVE